MGKKGRNFSLFGKPSCLYYPHPFSYLGAKFFSHLFHLIDSCKIVLVLRNTYTVAGFRFHSQVPLIFQFSCIRWSNNIYIYEWQICIKKGTISTTTFQFSMMVPKMTKRIQQPPINIISLKETNLSA